MLVTKDRIFFLLIILFKVITEDANDIKFNVLSSSIASFIIEFSNVAINVLNKSKRTMSVLDNVVLDYCREI